MLRTITALSLFVTSSVAVAGNNVSYIAPTVQAESVPLMSPFGLAALGAVMAVAAVRVLRNKR
ncbi:MAG: hypothetical protein AAGI11_00620 [Pseudomonadota bacterium]